MQAMVERAGGATVAPAFPAPPSAAPTGYPPVSYPAAVGYAAGHQPATVPVGHAQTAAVDYSMPLQAGPPGLPPY
eukprot:359673-Chlamydomonas_euryale.AAC.3